MKYSIIVLAALLIQSCSNKKAENDWTRNELQGKVLSYSEFSYEVVERFGNIKKGKRKRQYSFSKDKQNKYDEKGNEIESNGYNSDGSLDYKYTYKYDEKGNKIEWNSYKSDGSLNYKFTYKYDEKGNEIEWNSYNSDGSLDYKYTYKYDEKGNEIESNRYKSDGSLNYKFTYKYEFDKQDNWIKKIIFLNEIPKYILEREYEYYN